MLLSRVTPTFQMLLVNETDNNEVNGSYVPGSYLEVLPLESETGMLNPTIEIFSSIVMIASVCKKDKALDMNKFKYFWYNDFPKELEKCTLGHMKMNSTDRNLIFEVDIPCKFTSLSTNNDVDTTLLNNSNYNNYVFELTLYALDYVSTIYNVPITDYRFKVLVLPPGLDIKWSGLGVNSCSDERCYTWINDQKLNPYVYLHEIGHNLGLGHAWQNDNEYGDESCVMGSGYSGGTCFNAAHRDLMKWDTPIQSITFPTKSFTRLTTIINDDNEYIKVNKQVFIEFVHKGKKTIGHVYILYPNASTSAVCTLQDNNQVCILNERSIALNFTNDIPSNGVKVQICYYEGLDLSACFREDGPQDVYVRYRRWGNSSISMFTYSLLLILTTNAIAFMFAIF
jgi:hypothetical protein